MKTCFLVCWTLIALSISARAVDVEALEKSTVKITTYDRFMVPTRFGSGVVVDVGDRRLPPPAADSADDHYRGSWVMTNAHVILGALRIEVQAKDGRRTRAGIRWLSVDWDLAIVQTQEEVAPGLPVNPVAIKSGDPVWAVGMPEGLEWSVSTGIVAAVRIDPIDPWRRLAGVSARDQMINGLAELRGLTPSASPLARHLVQITAPISSGSSGGPICDANGHLIGLTTSMLTIGQNLNFGIQIDDTVAEIIHLAEREQPRHPGWYLEEIYAFGCERSATSRLNELTCFESRQRAWHALNPFEDLMAIQGGEWKNQVNFEQLHKSIGPLILQTSAVSEALFPAWELPLEIEVAAESRPDVKTTTKNRYLVKFPRGDSALLFLGEDATGVPNSPQNPLSKAGVTTKFLEDCRSKIPADEFDGLEASTVSTANDGEMVVARSWLR